VPGAIALRRFGFAVLADRVQGVSRPLRHPDRLEWMPRQIARCAWLASFACDCLISKSLTCGLREGNRVFE